MVAVSVATGESVSPGRDPQLAARAALRLREAMEFPSHKPLVRSARLAEDGGVWLEATESSSEPNSVWFILDRDARVAGRVELPPTARLLHADERRVLVSEPDEFDVPWLVRYRIEN